MLRSLVVMLVLANAGYLAWTKGWLASYGLAPASQSEPQRLTQQLRPEALRILSPLEARQLDPSPPHVCTTCTLSCTLQQPCSG